MESGCLFREDDKSPISDYPENVNTSVSSEPVKFHSAPVNLFETNGCFMTPSLKKHYDTNIM